MSRTFLFLLLLVAIPHSAAANTAISCHSLQGSGEPVCVSVSGSPSENLSFPLDQRCREQYGQFTCSKYVLLTGLSGSCGVVFVNSQNHISYDSGSLHEASTNAKQFCEAHGAGCRMIFSVCDPIAQGFNINHPAPELFPAAQHPPIQPRPAQIAQAAPSNDDNGWVAGAIAAIAEIDRNIWIGAASFDALLFLIFLIALWKNDARLNILGLLVVGCAIVWRGFSFIPSLFPTVVDYQFFYPILGLQRAAEMGVFAAGLPFLVLLFWCYFFDSTLPATLPHASKHIEVLVARSQRRTWLRRVVFMIDARMGVSAEQFDQMRKYRLGRVLVYDSLRRQRQNELARTHLEAAREQRSRTICLWREEIRGFFKRLWYLLRALVSFLIGFLFIRITIAKLLRGVHIESKSLDRILQTKNAIETGAADLRAYLIAAETFDGREELFEPS